MPCKHAPCPHIAVTPGQAAPVFKYNRIEVEAEIKGEREVDGQLARWENASGRGGGLSKNRSWS